MNRKTIELEITSEQTTELYNSLLEKSGEFSGRWFDGCLMDEFAVSMVDNQDWKINLSKGRPILARKYVYAYEKYLNCWSSKLVLVLTDDKEKFKEFCKSRFEEAGDLDGLDFEDFCWECGLDD